MKDGSIKAVFGVMFLIWLAFVGLMGTGLVLGVMWLWKEVNG